MKNVKAILAAALVAAGLGSSAKAISLGTLIGDPTYTGQLVFKYTNYDEGQIYDVTGKTVGAANAASSVPLDGTHTYTDINTINSNYAKSSSWGIFIVSSIYKVVNNVQVLAWADTNTDGVELTGVYWGEKDTTVVNNGNNSVTVYGKGTQYALFYDTAPDFNPASGPTAASLASATNGTVELTGTGSPIGLAADPNADFKSTYEIGYGNSVNTYGIYSNGISNGVTATVNNGSAITGEWNPSIAPGYQVQFTGVPFANGTTTSWDVLSNDPLMITAIPTPPAVWGGVILAGMVGMNVIRRRRAE
jgi:hypothetical protein